MNHRRTLSPLLLGLAWTSHPSVYAKDQTFCEHIAAKKDVAVFQVHAPELTDIKEVIATFAKDTKTDLLLDRNVTGKVIILQHNPRSVFEACEIFLSSLRLLGLTVVEINGIFSVTKIRNARRRNTPLYLEGEAVPETAQIVRKAVALRHASAKRLASVLAYQTPNGTIVYDQPSNSLWITATGALINHLLRQIQSLDVPCKGNCDFPEEVKSKDGPDGSADGKGE